MEMPLRPRSDASGVSFEMVFSDRSSGGFVEGSIKAHALVHTPTCFGAHPHMLSCRDPTCVRATTPHALVHLRVRHASLSESDMRGSLSL